MRPASGCKPGSGLPDLGLGRPHHRPHGIACDKKGETEVCCHLRDAETVHHVLDAGGEDGAAYVDAEGEEADLKGRKEFLGVGPVFESSGEDVLADTNLGRVS